MSDGDTLVWWLGGIDTQTTNRNIIFTVTGDNGAEYTFTVDTSSVQRVASLS